MTLPENLFRGRYGFAREAVTLANWRTSPYSRWSFTNVAELVPSAVIEAASGRSEPPLADPAWLLGQKIELSSGVATVGAFLESCDTDCLVVMKSGKVVADHHSPLHRPHDRHIIFSISKSLTAILAGVLEDEGRLDPEAPVIDYVPEMSHSAYAEATVRHVLDMRVAVAIEETYLDPMSAYGRYRRAMLWNPPLTGEEPESMLGFLASLDKAEGAHGGPFRYRSPNSDLLGIVVERASGQRYADIMRDRLWRGVGAHSDGLVTIDRAGTARAAGGVSMTARDLARVGEMMRLGGVGPIGHVVSERWVRDTLGAGDRAAWKAGDFPHLFANGSYRNKWYSSGRESGAFCAIGIHGQWLYVDPAAEVTIVRFSSQPVPVDDPVDLDCVRLFQAIAERI
ncbi:serine hydrolase [Mesorhizobium sp. KR9-304]|uniref:serine hydrolase domain-containing protein n=1 Tax=Mesorhizobium sp. KR9-304 TaxID=3156614 RepID=UPI0032B43558